jgi:hypothetical protein
MNAIQNDGNGPYFVRDPRSKLAVKIDWSAWLMQEATTITDSTWEAAPGIVTEGPSFTTTQTAVTVSSGLDGSSYTLRNTITCANGVIDSRSIRVVVKDR